MAADASDAELLTEGLTEEIDLGDRKQTWTYPSRHDCLTCHTANAGFVLGVNTRQLNGAPNHPDASTADNLLREWNARVCFGRRSATTTFRGLDRLVAISDSTATPEHRVRSYLDSNCAQCHRPGGSRTEFDARFDTPLDQQKLVNGRVMSSNMGIDGTKLIVPGDPDRSMIYLRMKRRQDAFNMPPLATHLVDRAAVAVAGDMDSGSGGGTGRPDSAAAPAVVPGRFDKVTALLQQHVDRSQVAGAVALVLQRGKPVFRRRSDWPTRRSIGRWPTTPSSGSPR